MVYEEIVAYVGVSVDKSILQTIPMYTDEKDEDCRVELEWTNELIAEIRKALRVEGDITFVRYGNTHKRDGYTDGDEEIKKGAFGILGVEVGRIHDLKYDRSECKPTVDQIKIKTLTEAVDKVTGFLLTKTFDDSLLLFTEPELIFWTDDCGCCT